MIPPGDTQDNAGIANVQYRVAIAIWRLDLVAAVLGI
jgi:hypothetical protein